LNWYKQSMINPITSEVEFDDIDVRRLMGLLARFKNHSSEALEIMQGWLDSGKESITLKEAEEELRYHMDNLGLSS